MEELIQCKLCDFKAKRIASHIRSKHNMEIDVYKKQYGEVVSEAYLEKIRANGRQASKTVDNRIYKHPCKLCGRTIEGKALICDPCKIKKAREKQEEKFKDKQEDYDFVRCQVCGWPDSRLTMHIRQHNLTRQQYIEKFPDSLFSCINLKKKTAFRGEHSDETKKKMSEARKGLTSWNSGLTKYDHPGLKSIADKAEIRMSQLDNNNWHTNPLKGERNGNFGKSTWLKGLKKDTSELVEDHSESNTGLFHHKSHYGNSEQYDKNHFVYQYREAQKERIKQADSKCLNCNETSRKFVVHHIVPESCFDHYDLEAHSYRNLVTLCEKCHSSVGQQVDNAFLKSSNFEIMKAKYPIEFGIFQNWKEYTSNRFVSSFPINKRYIQTLSKEQREKLVELIFNELRLTGFPKISYSEEELFKDFENVRKSSVKIEKQILRNYNSSGFKIRDHFIDEQYSSFHQLFNDDQKLRKLIRNRMGLDWKKNPEFFHIRQKTILRGFEVLFPSYRFSKYQASVAKWIIENFCEGNTIYDYAAGWGTRMLAAVTCKKNYVCVDTNSKLVEELKLQAEWLKKIENVNIQIENQDASVFKPEAIDFAYSCPPYGVQEDYNQMNYKTEKEWLNKYMIPVINSCYESLNENGRFICHLPVRLVRTVRDRLTKFQEVTTVSVSNKYSVFQDKYERVNEAILVYKK